jgi:hypothetical protein
MKALKGDLEMPVNRKTLLDHLAKPVTQEEWIRGYRQWVEQHATSIPQRGIQGHREHRQEEKKEKEY